MYRVLYISNHRDYVRKFNHNCLNGKKFKQKIKKCVERVEPVASGRLFPSLLKLIFLSQEISEGDDYHCFTPEGAEEAEVIALLEQNVTAVECHAYGVYGKYQGQPDMFGSFQSHRFDCINSVKHDRKSGGASGWRSIPLPYFFQLWASLVSGCLRGRKFYII